MFQSDNRAYLYNCFKYVNIYIHIHMYYMYVYVCLFVCLHPCMIKAIIFSENTFLKSAQGSLSLLLVLMWGWLVLISVTGELWERGKWCSSHSLTLVDNMQLNNNFTGPLPQLLQDNDQEVREFEIKDFFFQKSAIGLPFHSFWILLY